MVHWNLGMDDEMPVVPGTDSRRCRALPDDENVRRRVVVRQKIEENSSFDTFKFQEEKSESNVQNQCNSLGSMIFEDF